MSHEALQLRLTIAKTKQFNRMVGWEYTNLISAVDNGLTHR